MFKYVITFTKHGGRARPDTYRVLSDAYGLGLPGHCFLLDLWHDGKKLGFGIETYHRDTHEMRIQSLNDWHADCPLIMHVPTREEIEE